MMYLILEMLLLLAIAFLLGAIIGFIIGKMSGGEKPKQKKNTKEASKIDGAPIGTAPVHDSSMSTMSDDLSDDLSDDVIEFDIDDVEDAVEHDLSLEQPSPVMATDSFDLGTPINLDDEGYAIESLEGIGPQTGDLFRGYGIASVGDYLRKLHAPEQRTQAAQRLEILEPSLHKWAAMADLLRIEGVDHQFAELLVAADVHTVAELSAHEAEGLAAKLYEANNAGDQLISPISPAAEQLSTWIEQSKTMVAVVTF